MLKDKIIATDLDGTLLYPKKKISLIPQDSIDFINRFRGDGGRLLLVSSRNKYITAKISKKLNTQIDSIGCNGAYVTVNGKTVYEKSFDSAELKEILAYMRSILKVKLVLISSRDRDLVANGSGIPFFTDFIFMLYEYSQLGYKEPFVRSDHIFFEEIEKGTVYKAMCLVGVTPKKKKMAMEANKILRERFPNAEFSWIGEFIEITPKGVSKAQGINFYLDYLGISKDNISVIGDNGNDISMFENFKQNSYCMDHADEHVKKHAKHIIKRFADLENYLYPSEDKKSSKKVGTKNE